ncbi:MAG: formate dehydrogenase accessory sulfurtransferase FdhD [Anaerolineae bacterium]
MRGDAEGADRKVAVWRAYRLSADGMCPAEGHLVCEAPLLVRVDKHPVSVMMRTPGRDAELATGFLVSEGFVASASDIASVTIKHSCHNELSEDLRCAGRGWAGDVADVRLGRGAVANSSTDRMRMVWAVAGGPGLCWDVALPTVECEVSLSWHALVAASADLNVAQKLRERAGGVHGFGIYRDGGERLVVCEDVGRHNAMDKAIGWCLRHGLTDTWAFGLCSGRLSYEMVAKAARAGLPILASFSAPSSLGVITAERCNITLVGYLAGSQALAYTHPERLAT